MNALRIPTILQIEDNLADIEFTQEACSEYGCVATFSIARDGAAAIEVLAALAAGGQPLPDLVLLDLNLPKRSGHEVLAFLRAQPALASVPVVVLTSTPTAAEHDRSLALGATAHVIKPTGFDETLRLIKRLEAYLPA